MPVAALNVEDQDVLVEPTEPRYTKAADGTHIAYSVMGAGPIDLVYAFGYQSNIDADGVSTWARSQRSRLPATTGNPAADVVATD